MTPANPRPPAKPPARGGRPFGFGMLPYLGLMGGGGGSGGRSGQRIGQRAFKLWDVNPNKVGGFFGWGQGYKASKSPFIFFNDPATKTKTVDPVKEFFG